MPKLIIEVTGPEKALDKIRARVVGATEEAVDEAFVDFDISESDQEAFDVSWDYDA